MGTQLLLSTLLAAWLRAHSTPGEIIYAEVVLWLN